MDIKIEHDVLGDVSTNVYYLIYDRHVLIIDPAAEPERIISKIEGEGLLPSAILITHGHYDHFSAANELRSHFKVNVYAPAGDKKLFSDLEHNASSFMSGQKRILVPDVYIDGGVELSFAGLSLLAKNTPGHTAGSVSYYIDFYAEGYRCINDGFKDISGLILAGDTVFKNSVGRCDLFTGNEEVLNDTINNVFKKLPEDTLVLPGHGEYTFIGMEIERNPWFK